MFIPLIKIPPPSPNSSDALYIDMHFDATEEVSTHVYKLVVRAAQGRRISLPL